jgi:ABC-type transport system substrate-binding protein
MGEETAASLARRRNAQKPDAEYVALYSAGFAGGADPTQPLNFYFGGNSPNPVYSTLEISKIIAEGRSTMDNRKRAELIIKAVKLITDDVGIIPIINAVSVYGMKKNISFVPTKGVQFDFLFVKDITVK